MFDSVLQILEGCDKWRHNIVTLFSVVTSDTEQISFDGSLPWKIAQSTKSK